MRVYSEIRDDELIAILFSGDAWLCQSEHRRQPENRSAARAKRDPSIRGSFLCFDPEYALSFGPGYDWRGKVTRLFGVNYSFRSGILIVAHHTLRSRISI
jgi:hypothetical protein